MSDRRAYSVTALSKKLQLDRGTVRERLEENGFEPIQQIKGKETLYELTPDDLKLLANDEYETEKIRKTKAEADLKELELKIKSGEFASVKEFTDVVQRIFNSLHKKIAVELPKKSGKRLHNATSETEVIQLLSNEINIEFQNLRNDWKRYL